LPPLQHPCQGLRGQRDILLLDNMLEIAVGLCVIGDYAIGEIPHLRRCGTLLHKLRRRDLRQRAGCGRLHKIAIATTECGRSGECDESDRTTSEPLRSHLRMDATPWGCHDNRVAILRSSG
jgi:hypothetical protein